MSTNTTVSALKFSWIQVTIVLEFKKAFREFLSVFTDCRVPRFAAPNYFNTLTVYSTYIDTLPSIRVRNCSLFVLSHVWYTRDLIYEGFSHCVNFVSVLKTNMIGCVLYVAVVWRRYRFCGSDFGGSHTLMNFALPPSDWLQLALLHL